MADGSGSTQGGRDWDAPMHCAAGGARSPDADSRVPQGLVPALLEDEGRRAEGGMAVTNLVLNHGYSRLGPWLCYPDTAQRKTTTLRLSWSCAMGKSFHGQHSLLDSADRTPTCWALSEVKVQAYVVNGEVRTLSTWPLRRWPSRPGRPGDRQVLVVLHEAADGAWRAGYC